MPVKLERMGKDRKRREPRRERKRTKETLSESPIKVAIATTPQSSTGKRRALDQDTELTKAALLYADEVELVSLGMSMFDELRQVIDAGELGGYGLLASLDDDTINYLATRGGSENKLPPDWRQTIEAALSVSPEALEALGVEGAGQLRELQEMAAEQGRRTQQDLTNLLDEQGATELVTAIRGGAIKVAELGASPSSTLRPADLDPADSTDTQMWNWIDALVARLTDKKTRLLFDRDAGSLIQSMLEEGMIPANPQGLRLAAQAALGAGFTERLPAFPTAKMDELLDMRRDLALPLARYRGAVARFSKDMPQVVGENLDFEVEQLWIETVKPTLLGLEDEMADHGLVREIARSLDVQNIRDFGGWTAGTYFAVASSTALDALATGFIASAAGGAATVALEAVRSRREGQTGPKASELYYLYEANRRLA
ncbi:MAG TPA: hypothetical protein VMF51_06675 [Nocardioides sp.]|uniref:hypothetical protein n=1 Tax=Nocardioides sp. TaxID=35761 RepID=UPI002B6AC135|nr:hypothetical protein [Nocardioides sp.]HTW14795.1 hypothetical protein [Nocardioides sp.]